MNILRKTFLITWITVLTFISALCSSAEKEPSLKNDTKNAVHTITSVDELNTIIAEAGDRLLMFDLYADWCIPCKVLSPMLEQIAAEKKDKVTIYKINVDKNPEIAAAFSITGIPFVVYVKNQKGIHAFTGVQSKDAYVRAINLFSRVESGSDADITPDGEIIDGIRVIRRTTSSPPGNIYVYRGDKVRIIFDKVEYPYSIHIPAFNISREGKTGNKIEVTFKAKEVGVYPVFCNGKCPAGDGAHYGQIIVMQYKATGDASFSELTVEKTAALIENKKPLILDVRTPNEFYSGHIEGAKLIPLQQLNERINELSAYKDRDIIVYCRSGNRSTVASQILIKNGFKKLHNLRQGILGWKRAGKKVITK